MAEPLQDVSAVIPVYNGQRFIERAVQSVLQQSSRPVEIILVDDASTDATPAICRRLQSVHTSVRMMRFETNVGPADARNAGVLSSGHELIAFLDADDVWHQWHLETLVPLIRIDPRIGVISAITGSEGAGPPAPGSVVPRLLTLAEMLRTNPITQSSAVVRRSWFLASGQYRPGGRYAEDYDLWLRLLVGKADAAVVEWPTVGRGRHAGRVSVNNREHMIRHGWEARKRALDMLSRSWWELEEITQSLHAAWHSDFEAAWHFRDPRVAEILDASSRWLDSVPDRTRLMRRVRGQWPFWRVILGLRHALRANLLFTSLRTRLLP